MLVTPCPLSSQEMHNLKEMISPAAISKPVEKFIRYGEPKLSVLK